MVILWFILLLVLTTFFATMVLYVAFGWCSFIRSKLNEDDVDEPVKRKKGYKTQ